jgi:hypothetical protein
MQWGAVYQGWILAVCFFLDAWLLGVSLQRMTVGCTKVGISMRAAITNAVCRKAFAMVSSPTASCPHAPPAPYPLAMRPRPPAGQLFANEPACYTRPPAPPAFQQFSNQPACLPHRRLPHLQPSITKEQSADCVNFIASDIVKIFDGVADIHYLWTAPIEAGAILTILTVLVGVWAAPGERRFIPPLHVPDAA